MGNKPVLLYLLALCTFIVGAAILFFPLYIKIGLLIVVFGTRYFLKGSSKQWLTGGFAIGVIIGSIFRYLL